MRTIWTTGSLLGAADMIPLLNGCDTVAQLRQAVGADGDEVDVRGALQPGDGGDGRWLWSGGDTDADDGVFTVLPTGGGAIGRWKRIVTSPFFEAAWWGIDPTGVTPADSALQTADAAAALAGVPLMITAGIIHLAESYAFTASLVLAAGAWLQPAPGVTLTLKDTPAVTHAARIFDLSLGGSVAIAKPTGAVTPHWWGALGDVKSAAFPVTIAVNGAALVSPTALWSALDVGKIIIVPGAGTAGVAGGELHTTISAVSPDGKTATLASPALTALSGASTLVSWGHDDTTPIQAALRASANGLPIGVTFQPGSYFHRFGAAPVATAEMSITAIAPSTIVGITPASAPTADIWQFTGAGVVVGLLSFVSPEGATLPISGVASSTGGSGSDAAAAASATAAAASATAAASSAAAAAESAASGETLGQLPAASTPTGSDLYPVSQDGGSTLKAQTHADLAAAIALTTQATKYATLILTGSVTLDATHHQNVLLVAPTSLTIELPAPWPATFANLGDGFQCRVLVLAGVTVTLASSIATNSGASTVTGPALVDLVATTQGSTIFASIPGAGASGSTLPTAIIAAIPPVPILAGASTATASVSVALTNYIAGAPITSEFEYTIAGSGAFQALPAGAAVASGSGSTYTLTFQIAGLTSGSYTLQLKDTGNSNALSNSVTFSVEQVTGAIGVPSSGAQGTAITSFTCTLVDLTTGYACLYNSATGNETRVPFTSGAAISLTPAGGGTYAIRVYDAASGGNLLYQSASFAVTGSPTITLTQPGAQYWSTTFTISGAYTGAAPTNVDVQVDGTGSWTTLSGFTASGGAWSATVPNTLITSGASHTLTARETNLTGSVSGASGAIAFSAAPPFTITAVTPAAIGVVGAAMTFDFTYTGTLGTPTLAVDGSDVAVSNVTGSGGSGSCTIIAPALDATNGPLHTLTAAGTSGGAATTLFAAAVAFPAPFNFYTYDAGLPTSGSAHPVNTGGAYSFYGTATVGPTGNGSFYFEQNNAPPNGFIEHTMPQSGRTGAMGWSTSLVVPPGPLPAQPTGGTANQYLAQWGPTENSYHGYGFQAWINAPGTWYLWTITQDGYVLVDTTPITTT